MYASPQKGAPRNNPDYSFGPAQCGRTQKSPGPRPQAAENLLLTEGVVTMSTKAREVEKGILPSLALKANLDRKSTRLNSSHLVISYAVFCLKKKKKKY